MIAAIVLAAGASTRMGRPKQLLPLSGGTVLSTVVSRLLEAPIDRVVVVLGHEAGAIRCGARLPSDVRVEVVENEDWQEGMASSLRRGLDACADAEAVLIALGDQPAIEATTVSRLVSAFRKGASLALPVQGDRRGHPVLFGRTLYPSLRALTGDAGAREVISARWLDAEGIPSVLGPDLDTEEEYKAFIASSGGATDGRS